MISNNITLPYWALNVGVVSCLSVIRGSFAQSWSVWEHEACPLSGIKNVRSWEVVSVYLDSDFNPCLLYREVVLWWEGPLSVIRLSVPLYWHNYALYILRSSYIVASKLVY